MKKYLIVLAFVVLVGTIGTHSQAQSQNCLSANFPDGSVCVWIEKQNHGQYRVRSTVSHNHSAVALRCDIEYGNNPPFRHSGSCNDTFYYASNSIEPVTIDVWLGSNTVRRINAQYNFGHGSRASSQSNGQGNNNWSHNLYALDVYASSIFPNINQAIDVDIMALQNMGHILTNYNGTLQFTVQYRAHQNNNRQNAPSSSYTLDRNSYTFGWNDNGQRTLHNLIRFHTHGQYRLIIRDNANNTQNSIQFTVGGSSSGNHGNNTNLSNFGLSASRNNPSINQRTNVSIQARNWNNNIISNYNGTVSFSVQYRSHSNNNWQQAPTSSYSLDRISYTFPRNNNGQITLNNLIRFHTNGQYRLVVRDTWNNIVGYLQFNVGGTSRSNNPGFTTTQMNQIQGLYSMWPEFIRHMEDRYPRLRSNNTRQSQQSSLYQELFNITRGFNSVYNNYDQFFNAFRDWYIYTLQVR